MAAIDDPRGGGLSRYWFFSAPRAIRSDVADPTSQCFDIIEHCRRETAKAAARFLNHLDIALGSQAEVEVQLEIAKRVGFLAVPEYSKVQAIVEEVGRMLNGLITSVQPREEDA